MSRDEIDDALGASEIENEIAVVIAAESDSRAQGLASPGSDHDIRGVFVRPLKQYFSLVDRPASYRVRPNDRVDMHLADLRWLLGNLTHNNPMAIAIVSSSSFYRCDVELISHCRDLHARCFDTDEAAYHLASLARVSLQRTQRQKERATCKDLTHPLRLCVMLEILDRERRYPEQIEAAETEPLLRDLRLDGQKLLKDADTSLIEKTIGRMESTIHDRARPRPERTEAIEMADRILFETVERMSATILSRTHAVATPEEAVRGFSA